jgi:hypothetical protein
MKREITFFFILLVTSVFCSNSIGQSKPEISFKTDKQYVLEPKERPIKVSVSIVAKNGDDNQYPISITINDSKKGTAESEDYAFSEQTIQIDKKNSSQQIWITVKEDKKIEGNESIVLEIKKDSNITRVIQTHTVFIEEVPTSVKNRLTTGVDFDFETKENPLSFYGELNGFYPDLFKKKYGISYRIFSNRFSSVDTLLSNNGLNIANGAQIISATDTLVPIKRIHLSPTNSTKTRIYGLSFSPILRLVNGNNSTIYGSLLIEGMISTTNSAYSYDTTSIRFDTVSLGTFNNFDENRLLIASRSNQFVTNIALAIPIRIYDEKYEVMITPGFGYSKTTTLGNNSLYKAINPFYLLNINVIDQNFGITIGGEIRNSFNNNLPLINIYIAKSFNFVNFTKFN